VTPRQYVTKHGTVSTMHTDRIKEANQNRAKSKPDAREQEDESFTAEGPLSDRDLALKIQKRIKGTLFTVTSSMLAVRGLKDIRPLYALGEDLTDVDHYLVEMMDELNRAYEHLQRLQDRVHLMMETGYPYEEGQ